MNLEIVVSDIKIKSNLRGLEQFLEGSKLFLNKKSIKLEELKSIHLTAKQSPFAKCLIEELDQSLPQNVFKNIKLTTAILFCADCCEDNNWSNRIKKVKGHNNYQYKREEVIKSLDVEIYSLASLEEYLISFDKEKSKFEDRSLSMFEDIQRFLFEYFLTENEQVNHKSKCSLLYDEQAIFIRTQSNDSWTKEEVEPYFSSFCETLSLRTKKNVAELKTPVFKVKNEVKVDIPDVRKIRSIDFEEFPKTVFQLYVSWSSMPRANSFN